MKNYGFDKFNNMTACIILSTYAERNNYLRYYFQIFADIRVQAFDYCNYQAIDSQVTFRCSEADSGVERVPWLIVQVT